MLAPACAVPVVASLCQLLLSARTSAILPSLCSGYKLLAPQP